MLDPRQRRRHRLGQGLGREHAEGRIQFVDVAHGGDACRVLRYAAAVAEPGRAVVAGPRGDPRQSLAHVLSGADEAA